MYIIVIFNKERPVQVVGPFDKTEGEDNSDTASWVANKWNDRSGMLRYDVLELRKP